MPSTDRDARLKHCCSAPKEPFCWAYRRRQRVAGCDCKTFPCQACTAKSHAALSHYAEGALPLGSPAKECKVWQDPADGSVLKAVAHARPTAVDEMLGGHGNQLFIDLYHQATCPASPSHFTSQNLEQMILV